MTTDWYNMKINSNMFKLKFASATLVALLLVLVSCHQTISAKLDCYPIGGATEEKCRSLGCVWSPAEEHSACVANSRVNEPWCYFPENYEGYRVSSVEEFDPEKVANENKTHRITLNRVRKSALGDDISQVHVDIHALNDGSLLRLRVTDAAKDRFEPELPKLSLESNNKIRVGPSKFSVELASSSMNNGLNSSLIIRRKSTGGVVFSTDLRRLIFSEKFIQLNSRLNSVFVYGLGEHYDTFLKQADRFRTYSFWNTDKLPLQGGQRSYGGFPFYVNLEKSYSSNMSDENQAAESTDGGGSIQAHGIYLRNSNAMDVVLQKDNSITFRPIGGILDLFIFIGPTPMQVVSQFQHLVGLPELPPRWALGFHLCRYNYGSLNKTRLVWERTRAAGIPFDVQWNDIDYMDRYNDFTYDQAKFAGLPEFVDQLHSVENKMRYMILFDPGLSQEDNYYPYQLGNEMDIWIKNATNGTLVGKVWNQSGRTVFPDFANPKSHQYWRELFAKFQQVIKFDGAWIDMNDISNFVHGSLDGCPSESPQEATPYMPGGYSLQEHTLCLSAQHHMGQLEYDVHNLYSFYEAIATKKALEHARPGKRSLVISRSTHPGQGHYGGHWSGDVRSDWDYLRWSVASLIEHSMYGYSLMGSDICGFSGNTTAELCARWSTLGAFYTFSRNHNDDVSIDQDPVALGPEVVAANRNALTKKYSLLPYLYTQVHHAHKHGEPVARALIFEFFNQEDDNLLAVESQFMLGSALMVSPIVWPNTYSLKSYLPRGRWYETDVLPESAQNAPKLIDSSGQTVETHNVGLDNLVLFLRGGHMLPMYTKVGLTTAHTVEGQPIGLEVALCERGSARGELMIDDGESIDAPTNHIVMQINSNRLLNLTMLSDDYQRETRFGQVKVYGVSKQVSEVVILASKQKLLFNQKDHMLTFDLQSAALNKARSLVVEWN